MTVTRPKRYCNDGGAQFYFSMTVGNKQFLLRGRFVVYVCVVLYFYRLLRSNINSLPASPPLAPFASLVFFSFPLFASNNTMSHIFQLIHFLALLCLLLHSAKADKVFELNITTTSNTFNPDCSDYISSSTLLVNGQLPGPPIKVTRGERVQITVRNMLSENITSEHAAIHYHGIRQYGSNFADGVPFLTQHPIPPGQEFTHDFRVVNQAGTYFYHAHVGLQEETVFGAFIVYDSDSENNNKKLMDGPYEYDDERIIMLSEWWHRPRNQFEDFLLGPQFDFIPEADSVLVNGQTIHDPKSKLSKDCKGYSIVPVDAGKTYRLRVIGSTTFRTLGFAIAHHNLTVIEVDGELVKPYTVPFLEVTPGQRFSVLLNTDQAPRDYAIQTSRLWAEGVDSSSNGYALLRYNVPNKIYPNPSVTLPPMDPPILANEVPHWIWSDLEPLYGVDPIVSRSASRTIKLRSTEARMPDGTSRWFINGVSFTEPGSPILHDIYRRTRRLPETYHAQGYDAMLGTYPIKYYEVVDFVLQATHKPGEPCRTHPWHTHGHSHWEIAHGPGEYDEQRDRNIRNVPSPVYRDITLTYPELDPELEDPNGPHANEVVGCGWTKIRIIAVS